MKTEQDGREENMFRKFLEKIGLIKKPTWWERMTEPAVFVIVIIFAVVVLLIIIPINLKKQGSVGNRGAKKSGQEYRNSEMEQAYRENVEPVLVNYLHARVLYEEQGDKSAYLKWRVLAEQAERALLDTIVPAYYKDIHLRAIIALSLDKSGIDDMLGAPSDAGKVVKSLKVRGQEKFRKADDQWKMAVEGQDWLRF